MDYNELKIRVLSLFEASAELDGQRVRNLLSGTKIELSDKAVEMALLRYSRQGLLARTRRSGRFHYRMTEKGLARRIWLFFFQAEDGIRDLTVTGVQTCALPI